MTDSELLRKFADETCESAFAELVQRRINFVYSAALRQLAGDKHRAKDITQEVFIDLARKAAALKRHPDLLGWLYMSTRFAALRAETADLQARLDAAENRVKAAEDDVGALVTAVGNLQAAKDSIVSQPKKKNLATLSHSEALAEIGAFIEKMETDVQSISGYKPYQPPDESPFTAQQREAIARERAAAREDNHVFVTIRDNGAPAIHHVGGIPTMLKKQFPQLAPGEWVQFEQRYVRALLERVLMIDKSKAPPSGGK
jgi:DNA-directed RNA polymerase specialized sigma24 family protein